MLSGAEAHAKVSQLLRVSLPDVLNCCGPDSGVRSWAVAPDGDLWITYRTSSKFVVERVGAHGGLRRAFIDPGPYLLTVLSAPQDAAFVIFEVNGSTDPPSTGTPHLPENGLALISSSMRLRSGALSNFGGSPTDLAFDSLKGDVWYINASRHLIVSSRSGSSDDLGSVGFANLASASSGRAVLLDSKNMSLIIIKRNGRRLLRISQPATTACLDSSGTLYALDSSHDELVTYAYKTRSFIEGVDNVVCGDTGVLASYSDGSLAHVVGFYVDDYFEIPKGFMAITAAADLRTLWAISNTSVLRFRLGMKFGHARL